MCKNAFFLTLLEPFSPQQQRIFFLTYGFAKMYCVGQFFPQDFFARVSWHFEEEKTGVTLRKKIVGRIVLIHDLKIENRQPFVSKSTKTKGHISIHLASISSNFMCLIEYLNVLYVVSCPVESISYSSNSSRL